jgi:outer membrane receptor protein involved in Fe transport
VVTKEQMADFAMLDINDVFAYEAGTEGSGTFTDFSFNQSAQPNDNLAANPNTANRVRGLASANIAYGGFETSRRVPLDPISSEAVEISRGPNSNLFGLGNASGTANSVPATANLSRNRSQVQFRLEQYGRLDGEMGYRESVDVNRVLLKDKLALRFSEVFQRTEYNRQPSGVKSERYNAMVKCEVRALQRDGEVSAVSKHDDQRHLPVFPPIWSPAEQHHSARCRQPVALGRRSDVGPGDQYGVHWQLAGKSRRRRDDAARTGRAEHQCRSRHLQ